MQFPRKSWNPTVVGLFWLLKPQKCEAGEAYCQVLANLSLLNPSINSVCVSCVLESLTYAKLNVQPLI